PAAIGEADDGVQANQPGKNKAFLYHAAGSAVILLVAVILRTQQAVPGCAEKLNDGHWLAENLWQPRLCNLHPFTRSEVESCVAEFSHVVVIGADKWASAARLLCPTTTRDRKTTSQHNCETRYVGQSNTCAEDEQVVAEYIKLAQSPEEKGPVLVIHQPLFHVSPLAKDQLSAEALSKCKGQLMVQANAQLEMLAGRPGSLVIQLDSNPIWGPGTKEGGVDATQVYRDVYSSAQHNTSRLLYLTSAFTTGFPHQTISATTSDTLPPVSTLLLYFFIIVKLLGYNVCFCGDI
ncbi:hypothetical protein GBAR_LOCUS3797, partial [Geodia barretti]